MSVQSVGPSLGMSCSQASKDCCKNSILELIEKVQAYMIDQGLTRIDVMMPRDIKEGRIAEASILSCGHICRDTTLSTRPDLSNFGRYENVFRAQMLLLCPTCSSPVSQRSEIEVDTYRQFSPELVDRTKKVLNSVVYSIISSPISHTSETKAVSLCLELYQSIHQLTADKVVDTIKTLGNSQLQAVNLGLDFGPAIDLLLGRLDPSKPQDLGLLDETMNLALETNDPDHKVFLYKQVITHAPSRLDAYEKLIPLISSFYEKNYFLLKAVEEARKLQEGADSQVLIDLINRFTDESEKIMNPTTLSKEVVFSLNSAGNIFPLPGIVVSVVNLYSRSIIAPMFPEIALKDSVVARTLDSLDRLFKEMGDVGLREIPSKIPRDVPGEGKFYWMVMVNNPQVNLAFSNAELPSALDVANAILWRNRLGRAWHSGDSYIRCREKIDGKHVIVGHYEPNIIEDSANGNIRRGKGLVIKLEDPSDLAMTVVWRKYFNDGHSEGTFQDLTQIPLVP